MIDKALYVDYQYFYEALKKHPLLWENKEKQDEINLLYEKQQEKITDYNTLISAMTELTSYFHDGHTNIELPYTIQDDTLNLHCSWHDDDTLVLQEDYDDIPAGAVIDSIEGSPIPELIHLMSSYIPHENTYLVRSRMVEYPYMNYHLLSKMNLERLFGIKPSYEISFLSHGHKIKKQCVLAKYNGFLDFPDSNQFISYTISDHTAVLHLDECICNDQYKNTLHMLATECTEKNISTLVLDLSKNMGGSSSVIDEFIKYVRKDYYRRYQMIDYSYPEPKIITSREDLISIPDMDVNLPANILCKVSYTTFSSARTFAVTLKDNGIAAIIGSPTGGKPNSYGMPRKDHTPNFNIRFRVSRALFLRPDANKKDEDALYPDICR